MTGPDLAYRRTYPLSPRYSVEFVLDGPNLTARWLPALPKPKTGRELLPRYRTARNQFLASLGVPMLVIEL